ncbi:MAG TPA: hypothetical protein VMU94_25605, partial [Streptosporangiaceae bacterium]|nr:hypothetical protein [Streptosporangiaceae bacterium]
MDTLLAIQGAGPDFVRKNVGAIDAALGAAQGACKFGDLRGWFAPGLMAGRVRAGHGVAFWSGCAVLAVGGAAAGF